MKEQLPPKQPDTRKSGESSGPGQGKTPEAQALSRAKKLVAQIDSGALVSKTVVDGCRTRLREDVPTSSPLFSQSLQLEESLWNYRGKQQQRRSDAFDGVHSTRRAFRTVKRQIGEDFAKREHWVQAAGHQEHVDALHEYKKQLEECRKFDSKSIDKYLGTINETLGEIQSILTEVANREDKADGGETPGDENNFEKMSEADFKHHVAGLKPDQIEALLPQIADPGRKKFASSYAAFMRSKIKKTEDRSLDELSGRDKSLKIGSMSDEQLKALLNSPQGQSSKLEITMELSKRGRAASADEPGLKKGDEIDSNIGYKPTPGPAFVNGPKPGDVQQGGLGDCYLLSSMAAVAHTSPETISNMVKQNPDGTSSVDFKLATESGPVSRPETVSNKLPHKNPFGPKSELAYGQSAESTPDGKPETWVPTMEKAYAQRQGGYDNIAHGATPVSALEALTGKKATQKSMPYSERDPDAEKKRRGVHDALTTGAAHNLPMVAGTMPRVGAESGLVGGHAYTVMGVNDGKKGRSLTLRDPHGKKSKAHGKTGGVFELGYDEFQANFQGVTVAGLDEVQKGAGGSSDGGKLKAAPGKKGGKGKKKDPSKKKVKPSQKPKQKKSEKKSKKPTKSKSKKK